MGTAGSSLLSGSEERAPILPRGFERPEISVDPPHRPYVISMTTIDPTRGSTTTEQIGGFYLVESEDLEDLLAVVSSSS